jgi:hypothetical protein
MIQVSDSDIERMRAIVTDHDKKTATNEFDLNNPPRKPYAHKAFPKTIYDHESRRSAIVQNEGQLEEALASGWDTKPCPVEEPEQPLDAQGQREAAQTDEKLAELRKKKQKG